MGETRQLWQVVPRCLSIRPPWDAPSAFLFSYFSISKGPKSSLQKGHLTVVSPWDFWCSAQIFIHFMWILFPQPNLGRRNLLSGYKCWNSLMCLLMKFQASDLSPVKLLHWKCSCKILPESLSCIRYMKQKLEKKNPERSDNFFGVLNFSKSMLNPNAKNAVQT